MCTPPNQLHNQVSVVPFAVEIGNQVSASIGTFEIQPTSAVVVFDEFSRSFVSTGLLSVDRASAYPFNHAQSDGL